MATAALLGPACSGEAMQAGLRVLLYPLGSNVVIRTACCSVGIALPVYSSFKALEKNDPNEQRRWLIYWAVYGSFSLVEIFPDKLLSWFPMYYYMKFAFLLWLQFPSAEGSRLLYVRHLRPFLLKHSARLDNVVNFTSTQLAKIAVEHQRDIQFAKAILGRSAMAVNKVLKDVFGPVDTHPQNAVEDTHPQNAVEGRNLERFENSDD